MILHPIAVDDREQKPPPQERVAELRKLNVQASVQHLPVGDFMWAVERDDESIVTVIVERKSIADFLSSIPPSDRLPRFVQETAKYDCVKALLLEGNQFDFTNRGTYRVVEPDALDNMLADLQTHGIIVIRSKDETKTAYRLSKFWKWTGEKDHRTFISPIAPTVEHNYLTDEERNFVRVLMCVPGIGEDKAYKLIKEFKTPWEVTYAAMTDYKAFANVKGVSKVLVNNIARTLGNVV